MNPNSTLGIFDPFLPQIAIIREEVLFLLSDMEPNTPHPICDCGHSYNEHLDDVLNGFTALEALNRGDSSLYYAEVAKLDVTVLKSADPEQVYRNYLADIISTSARQARAAHTLLTAVLKVLSAQNN